MAKGGLSPRDAPRTLVPRPAKTGSRLPGLPPPIPLITERIKKRKKARQDSTGAGNSGQRLNKFVRRLHDMLLVEKDSGVVEWRRGLLVLFSTDAFAKKLLPKYFNTRNFKTFRRQLNYYGFVHVRSFSTTGSSTTALWVNHDLANEGSDDISSVLKLKRVEPCEAGKTAEGRRHRKEQAIFTVEEDIGVSAKTLQLEQIRYMAIRGEEEVLDSSERKPVLSRRQPPIPTEVHFITDTSTIGSNCCGSSDRGSDGFEDTTPPPESDDFASKSAANVLLMLSRA